MDNDRSQINNLEVALLLITPKSTMRRFNPCLYSCISMSIELESTLPYPTPPYPRLNPTLPHPTSPYHTLPHPTTPHPTLLHPTSPYPTLPHPTSPYPTLPHPTSPYPTLPHPTPPYLTIPHLTSPYPTPYPDWGEVGILSSQTLRAHNVMQ